MRAVSPTMGVCQWRSVGARIVTRRGGHPLGGDIRTTSREWCPPPLIPFPGGRAVCLVGRAARPGHDGAVGMAGSHGVTLLLATPAIPPVAARGAGLAAF